MIELLGLVGITIIVVHGTLFRSFRSLLPSLLNCALCTGFWIGLLGAALAHPPSFAWVWTAGSVSVIAFLTSLLVHRLQE